MKPDGAVGAEPLGGQDDNCRNPAECRKITKDGCHARRNAGKYFGLVWLDGLTRAAFRAEYIARVDLVTAMAAVGHLTNNTLRNARVFPQVSGQ